MTFFLMFLAFILGAGSVIMSFYFYPKIKPTKQPEIDAEVDKYDEKLNKQWLEMLNYDGNIKE